jgi:hypothetical protein
LISAPNTKAARRSEMLYRYKRYRRREFGVVAATEFKEWKAPLPKLVGLLI